MAMAIDGLASNLKTTELINSLMQVEAAPQTSLKNSLALTKSRNSAFQTLNSLVAALKTAAEKLPDAASLTTFTAASSATSVTAVASSSAAPASLSFTVDQLARRQTSVTAAAAAWTGGSTLTIDRPGEDPVEIPATTDLKALAKAINDADAGVTATTVQVGVDGTGAPLLRLQLTSDDTGADAAFRLWDGSAAAVAAGTATDVFAAPGAAHTSVAADAEITLWAGSAAEQKVTSSTNTFSSVLTGVDITVSAVEAAPVTISVDTDDDASAKAFEAVTTALQKVFTYIAEQSVVTTSTRADGSTSTTGGAFTGDSTVRRVREQLRAAIADPVGGLSPSAIGVSFTREGALKVDADALRKALADDPAAAAGMAASIAQRLTTSAGSVSDKYEGYLTARVTSGEDLMKNLAEQIESWDDRLATRRATLERTYSALEVQLANLNSQSSWLASQLSSLN